MEQIEEILCREPRGVLSLTGGGGKTSLMFHLARLLVRSGRKVLTTTTTRILAPSAQESEILIVAPDPSAVLDRAAFLPGTGHLTAAAERLADVGKLKGFPPEAIRTFAGSGLFDWIIVEADGAARRPLKAPAGHEPVIPDVTTVAVAVAGLEVVGEPLSEEIVFRSELAGRLMGILPGEPMTEAALARLLAHPSAPLKGAPSGARRFIFLNKAETPQRRAAGARIAAELGRLAPFSAEAVIVGEARGGIRVHGVYPLGRPS